MLNLEENPKGSTNINDALLNAIDTGKKISDIDRKSIFVWWVHGHVPTQHFEIYVAVHPISDVPVNCMPTHRRLELKRS